MIHTFTICSMNCQGLGNYKKRRDVLDHLKSGKYSIICVQDTHFIKSNERLILTEWGYKAIFSSFTSNSRGVAMFLQNTFQFNINETISDPSGNFILLDITIDDIQITIVNIYAPNNDSPQFFENLKQLIMKQGNQNVIIVGDWNLLLNPTIDGVNYKHVNNPNAQNKVKQIMNELALYDAWREDYPDQRLYTWTRKVSQNTIQMGRLDFFLISENLYNMHQGVNILPGYRTDHSLITLSLQLSKQTKRSTFWKFNCSLLKHKKYIEEIKQVINENKIKYAVSPYDPNNIETISNEMYQSSINPHLFFEMLLLDIRNKSIAFSTAMKRKENIELRTLNSDIERLERMGHMQNIEQIEKKKDELLKIREKRMEGVMIRAKVRWIEDGEKPTNYFCNLENRNFTSKIMKSIITNTGEETFDTDTIVHTVKDFYENLYSFKASEEVDLKVILETNTPKLSDVESHSLEGNITLEEAAQALSKMKNMKSPGSDGFTAEFYKFFWKDLAHFLLKSINYGFEIGELSVTQKEGLIICIPKPNKPKQLIKNWRPISLLNVSYKIASACIASRIKKILPIIIDPDQSGFMSDRFTGDNIRLIYDILNYANKKHKTGILLLIDFEKAFDSVSWSFLNKSLSYFNLGPNLQKWVKIFYTNIKSSIMINGKVSHWFKIGRGCRQGDPISPYLFLICAEVLAILIRQNHNIKGFKIHDTEIKISQFADDTSLFLDGTKESFEYCIETILEYAKFSGLCMNFEKTKVIPFGETNANNNVFCPHLKFEWSPKTFTVLGIEFTINLKDITDNNIKKAMEIVKNTMHQWQSRFLTPFGKITVIKAILMSKLVHIIIPLPNPSNKIITDIQSLFFKFLWDNKPDKIKREYVTQPVEGGGLGMLDLKIFIKSLKVTWLRRLLTSKSKWKFLLFKEYNNFKYMSFFGPNFYTNIGTKMNNTFWKEVMSSIEEYAERCPPCNPQEFISESFLYNKHIHINGQPITYNIFPHNNIFFIHQLKNNNTFMSYDEFRTKYQVNINFLTYTAIIIAIKTYERILNYSGSVYNAVGDKGQKYISNITNYPKGSSHIYKIFNNKNITPTGVTKWINKTNMPLECAKIMSKLKHTTNDVKLRWFQTRIVHYILTTNYSVSKFDPTQTPLCTFCKLEPETIEHMIWDCGKVQEFWTDLERRIQTTCTHTFNFKFNKQYILFGVSTTLKTDKICDFIILLAKFFIYKSKVQGEIPNIINYNRYLLTRYYIENEIYTIKQKENAFRNLWNPYIGLINPPAIQN